MRQGMILLLALFPGCDAWDEVFNPNPEESDADTDADADSDVDTDTDADADPVVDPDPPQPGTWTVRPHPCVGGHTDTLLIEDGGSTLWVGCGTSAEGRGLFRSTNAGVLWEEVAVGALHSWRINDLQRAADGNLYIAGVDVDGDGRGAMMDSAMNVTELLTNEGQLWNAMVTGSVRRTPSGDIVFESLNGTDVAFQSGAGGGFYDAYGWWTNGIGKQILDLEIDGEDFYGVGSTISSPPVVFLPPYNPREGFQMRQVELSEDFDGELWDIHLDREGIVVAGVNQDENHGVVFISRSNPYEAADWRLFEANILFPSDTTWFRGVCRGNGKIVAVGEYSISEVGLIAASDDGGLSWYSVPLPGEIGPVQLCEAMPDGTFRFAGADGFYASYTF